METNITKADSVDISFDKLERAVKFFNSILFKHSYEHRECYVDIDFKSHEKMDGRHGLTFCEQFDESFDIENEPPEDFYIEIDETLEEKDILLTLAHEMVHVKQMAMLEFIEICDGAQNRIIWHYEETEENNYWDCPWEIEAFGRELGLYTRFMESEK